MSAQLSERELRNLLKRLEYMDKIDDLNGFTATNKGDSIDGSIKVENNEIIVTDPIGAGQHPTIEPKAPIQLKKNGEEIFGNYMIETSMSIQWEVKEAPLFQIEVTSDKLNAYLKILSIKRYGWKLVDKPPSIEMVLEAEEDPNVILESLSLYDVLSKLEEMRIKNLIVNAIYSELHNPTFCPILVANGLEPTTSQDAYIELFFSEKVESQLTEKDGIVDFRDHLKIPHVKKGDVIAKKHKSIQGDPGFDVYGAVLTPRPPKDIPIVAKENVVITESGLVVALKEGRPRITGFSTKYFDICSSYIIPGDVDIITGNIVFSGDIIIYGNVTEGMIVESLGNVYIGGNVFNATITATGSIVVKGNTFKSELYSGYFGVIFNRLYMSIKKMSEFLYSITDAVTKMMAILSQNGKSSDFKMVLLIIIESKFYEILKTSKEIIYYVDSIQGEYKNELSTLKDEVFKFSSIEQIGTILSIKQVEKISNLVFKTYKMIEGLQESEVQIDLSQSNLSDIKSTGSILIRGKGVLQSTLYAGTNIIFYDKDAVCRGGQLECGDTISAMTIGGETGGETQLKAGKKIMFNRMNAGRICVGRHWKQIFEPIQFATVVAEGNKLAIHRSSEASLL